MLTYTYATPLTKELTVYSDLVRLPNRIVSYKTKAE